VPSFACRLIVSVVNCGFVLCRCLLAADVCGLVCCCGKGASSKTLLLSLLFCSQLVCMHFGAWDNAKEWSVSMPVGEDIQVHALTFRIF